MKYDGILFFGQTSELGGRGISGYRLRSAAERAGFNILIIDFVSNLSADQILNIVQHNYTDNLKFVGFSTSWIEKSNEHLFTWLTEDFFKTIKLAFPSVKLITGGHDEWNRKVLLNYTDYHFHGYSDNTFVEFLKMISGSPDYKLDMQKRILEKYYYINSNISDPIKTPDEIETVFKKEDEFLSYQPVPIEISRGCIFRCGFCRHPFQGKKDFDSYQRTPENIARELKRNYDLFGTTKYTIMDDTFNDSIEKIDRLKRAIDIAKLPDFKFVAYIRPELLVTKPEMINMLGELGLRGAFFGIESFKKESRASIGKGTNIDKVLDAAHKLATYNNNQVLIHASLIVGLPYESEEEIRKTQDYLIGNNGVPFRSWVWQALGIRNDPLTPVADQSMFDKNFAQYGYSIPENSNRWKNEHFTMITANQLANELNQESSKYQRIAGWWVAGAWYIGRTEEQIQSEMINSFALGQELNKYSKYRSEVALEKLLGKK